MADQNTTNRPEGYSEDAAQIMAQLPWAAIPTDNTLPEIYYDWLVKESYPSDLQIDGENAKPRVVWNLELEALAPDDWKGVTHNVTFFIGTEEDPRASQLATVMKPRSGGSKLKILTIFCGCENQPLLLKGKKFGCFVQNSTSKKTGRSYTNLDDTYYHPGQVAPGTAATKTGQRYRPQASPANGTPPAQSTTVMCPSCQMQIPRDEIVTHVGECQGATV